MSQTPSFSERLAHRMESASTLLGVGLDPVLDKLPAHLPRTPEGVVRFCQDIIEATHPSTAVYKPNLGFFTALGRPGLNVLWAVRHSIPAEIPVLLDCKVGDVGETARAYAHGWFNEFGFDAITVSPYLGEDATAPFMEYEGKGVIILCKTSNPGSGDFQDREVDGDRPLYLAVADRCREWEARYPASVGLVVGATYPGQLKSIRALAGDLPILLPGVGAQSGDLEASLDAGLDSRGLGLMCSASRAVIYAGSGIDYDVAAASAAESLRDQINTIRLGLAVA
jgi:orotidine-5'-phosphate decarboxylase